MSAGNRRIAGKTRDPDLAGAEAAMHRAAGEARRRAAEAANATEHRQSRRGSGEFRGKEADRDPRKRTFSQAQGYEEIPGPLELGELPREARTHIWNIFYGSLKQSSETDILGGRWIVGSWQEILREKHVSHDILPLDDWHPDFGPVCEGLRADIETMPLNKVFDLLQFIMRHPKCPTLFIVRMKDAFTKSMLAYKIDQGKPPTIVPSVTEEEGQAIVESLKTLRQAGLRGGTEHLRNACDRINEGDWSGSVRESIHTVESVARMLAPGADTLKPALASIEKHGGLHPALKGALSKLYGYTSNEQGIRHPLLDGGKAKVGMDEAVLMLGACASFASYLSRKGKAPPSGPGSSTG